MTRRRSRRRLLAAAAALGTLFPAGVASAQRDATVEGAIFLLRPTGARSVGIGQAVVARADGTESIWWNPAALAAATRREVAIHHSQDFFATGDALALIIPAGDLGVVGLVADIQDYGEQENTDGNDLPASGTILTRSFVLSATYATPLGPRARAGVAFKVIQFRYDCTGPCDLPTSVAQTFGFDAGVQYALADSGRLTIGASVRNLGVPLQVEDSPQADPLPSRVQAGFAYRYTLPAPYADADLTISTDVIGGLQGQDLLPRVGGELTWQKRATLRAGYVFEGENTEAGGPALGLGIVSGNVTVDIARVFTGFSADAGQAPTFLSLRFHF